LRLTDRERWSRMGRAATATFQTCYRQATFGERIRDVPLGAADVRHRRHRQP
jgi:hypothetical protein